ncbi:flavin reductase family protein [Klebsiella michiganensis]|uniref:flavin reductase family protein n=1 Tax=Klebsiella michiganensis TaxID=1134687 RepID=UPI000AAEAFA7|nr:flavin reductase family protein [Klebsiella michiganensis]
MKTQLIDFKSLYFGSPVAIISSLNPDGTTNLSPVSSWWILDKSIVFGIGTSGKCYENMTQCSDMVLNIPDMTLWRNVEAIAATTGKENIPLFKKKMGYRFEVDKFSCSGLTEISSLTVSPGRVKECPIQIEAKVVNRMFIGNEQKEIISMEANILNVHIFEKILSMNNNDITLNINKWNPLYYVFRNYFSLGTYLGRNFRCN